MKNTTKRKLVILLGTCIFTFLLFTLFNRYYIGQPQNAILSLEVKSDKVDEYQVYYNAENEENWVEENSIKQAYTDTGKADTLKFNIPLNSEKIRIDLGNSQSTIEIKDIVVKKSKSYNLKGNLIDQLNNKSNEVNVISSDDSIIIETTGTDPYIEFDNVSEILSSISGKSTLLNVLMIIGSLLLGFIAANSILEFKNAMKFVKMSYDNKNLIKTLAKNDFKNKYASSYLGVVWGFIQPLVTIGVYWFVFQVGFRSGDVGDVPFILWFICGIVPWFFFSETLPSATNVFIEYSYLVKKVVFKIEVLPMVKIISALFVHLFFILFIYIILAMYGYYPDVYTLQFIYYSACMLILVFSLSIFTSAVILFFRDLGQIIGIILSVGFWFTPIGWNLSMLPEFWGRLFKLNPLYYIVTGYRDSFIDKNFFWERPYEGIYFWAFCLVVLFLGVKMFNKLKPHFSDVI